MRSPPIRCDSDCCPGGRHIPFTLADFRSPHLSKKLQIENHSCRMIRNRPLVDRNGNVTVAAFRELRDAQ